MCEVSQALGKHDPALRAIRDQLTWGLHHWRALAERLSRPEEPPSRAPSGSWPASATEVESALYDNMADDDLR